jgi:hypothetical protein
MVEEIAQKRAEHIGVEHPCIAIRRLLGQRAGVSFGAGIVDRDVQPTEAPDSLFDKVAHVVFVTHVRQNESGISAEATKLVFERLAFGLAAAAYDDGCAFFGKGKRRGTTDAGQSAGDEDNRSVHRACPSDRNRETCWTNRLGYWYCEPWLASG